jgi:hypothetical protein
VNPIGLWLSKPIRTTRSNAGDQVLLYGLHPDGNIDAWAKGVWGTYFYENVAGKADACGFADKSRCNLVVIKDGVSEWWVQVKTSTGLTGWMLAVRLAGDERSWRSGNFGDLCQD